MLKMDKNQKLEVDMHSFISRRMEYERMTLLLLHTNCQNDLLHGNKN